jgi:predicted nucleotidyltransferase
MDKIKNVITKVKKELENVYKKELVSLILFGSQARGEANQYIEKEGILLVALADLCC